MKQLKKRTKKMSMFIIVFKSFFCINKCIYNENDKMTKNLEEL